MTTAFSPDALIASVLFAVAIALSWYLVVGRWLGRHRDRLFTLTMSVHPGERPATIGACLDLLDKSLRGTQRREATRHPVSGLPMRETLLGQIASDGRGILGVVTLSDFDRVCAFDPAQGEQLLAVTIERLRRMVGAERLIAHVDRAHLAMWYAGDVDTASVQAQLDAIAYALRDAIEADGQTILPQVQTRASAFVAAANSPKVFLVRTLASFAVAPETTSSDDQPCSPADQAREQYALEQDLHHAIVRGELELYFQPLIDAGRERICGAEALLRWNHPQRGQVSPGQFIPIMEAMGLASEIGLWVLNSAVREADAWRREKLGALRVAVNVSGLQLERDDLATLVQRTLERHRLPASALEIELTESVATSDADHCRRIFEALRAMGVKLAVDDFGTGYSGFSTLRALAFDKIKIDREFVTDVDQRRDSQAICQSIIALGRGLGVGVLAEGVETRAEYEWLRRHGCSFFQGFYFGHPVPAEAFRAVVRDTRRLAHLLSLGVAAERQRLVERLSA